MSKKQKQATKTTTNQQQQTEKPPPPQPPLESRPNEELLVKQAFNIGTHHQPGPKEPAQIAKTENG